MRVVLSSATGGIPGRAGPKSGVSLMLRTSAAKRAFSIATVGFFPDAESCHGHGTTFSDPEINWTGSIVLLNGSWSRG